MMTEKKPDPDWLALAGIALTIAIHLTLVAAGRAPNAPFICGACLVWAGYVLIRFVQTPEILRQWGFRRDNLCQASALPSLLLLAGASVLAVFAWQQGHLRFPWHTWILLVIYPIWGIVQQFLALGIVFNNLERVPPLDGRPALVVIICAALFGLVHIYDPMLALATGILELALILLYRRQRNLWPLGFVHGWLGGLFYLWVLNEDLWAEIFAS